MLESPTGLELKGDKRKVTMMMTDLRGFTSLSERLAPERVVALLNRYLTTMVTVIKQYQGTIDEIHWRCDLCPLRRSRVAGGRCATGGRLRRADAARHGFVNEQNRQEDLPEVEMGIGVHTGQVVVGNIGSPERMKYGVVGSHVNLTSRIQSYTTGGQILISETTRKEVGPILRAGKQMEVKAKGIEHPVTLSEVLGIGGPHRLFLPETTEALAPLIEKIPLRYEIVEAKSSWWRSLQRNFDEAVPQSG